MLQGPRKELCPCGPPSCGLFGTPLRGKVGHIRGCPCRRCGGKRSRRTGLDAQRKVAKAAGIKRVGSFFPGHEEHYGGAVRIESKAGAQVGPIITRFRLAEAQSEAQRPLGDHRPFLMAASHEGVALGIFRLDQAANIAAALADNLGLLVGEDAEDPADRGRDVGQQLEGPP
jgi:hypothetical protein